MDPEDIIELYRKKFGRLPPIASTSWTKEYPIEEIIDAIDSNTPIEPTPEPDTGVVL